MGNLPKVAILLSTYNGEEYIEQQIDSILNQEKVKLTLFIRDDGSSDKTIEILNKYNYENIIIYKEKNIGAAMSFIDLLFTVDNKFDYYAFSDQDDYWEKDKIFRAIDKIRDYDSDKPILYHSLAGMVDVNLNPILNKQYVPKKSFGGALISSGTGCTMVFNSILMTYLKLYKPKWISMHDAWVYRVCYAIDGSVFYDKDSYIKYRQHEQNLSGSTDKFHNKLKKVLFKNKNAKSKMASEILVGYSKYMTKKNILLAETISNYRESIKFKMNFLINKEIVAVSKKTTLQIKLLALINRL